MSSIGGLIQRHWQTFPCPQCGFENECQMGQAERHETVLCRGCHLSIRLSDGDSSVFLSKQKADAAMDDLMNTLRKAFKKFG
jgi:transcription elongation factor Elf1